MALLRVRTEIDDRPGALARLTAALAAHGANILDLSVQVGTGGVIDEFVLDVPAATTGADVAEAMTAAGGRRTAVLAAAPHELIDDATHALTLAARARARPRELPRLLGELLRAGEAEWADEPAAAGEPGDALSVPVGHGRYVALRRTGWPFTLTESARAGALVRSVLPVDEPAATAARRQLADGTEVVLRPIEPADAGAVRDMHDRCSRESRRLRYFSAKPRLPDRLILAFCDRGRGLSLVASGPDGSVLGLAHLMYTLDPGVAELAFLIEDRWQGRGLGASLGARLLSVAREEGLVEARVMMLRENRGMRGLLVRLGGRVHDDGAEPGVLEGRIALGYARNRSELTGVEGV
jgi:GNAT superfamily N-acetyltransferase/predicted amino acid-binding ACT domain protein